MYLAKELQHFLEARMRKKSSLMPFIHNGHYIAATFSAFLSTITSYLGSIPWEIGCTLARWQKSLNIAIEKKLGIQILEELCTIHLLKADYNMGTKLIFAQ